MQSKQVRLQTLPKTFLNTYLKNDSQTSVYQFSEMNVRDALS